MEFMDFLTFLSTTVSGILIKKVFDMPRDYVLKSDFKHFENKIENKLDRIDKKLDDLMKG
jgi:hypothetical protein